ncbi:MAG: NAD(P)/FAD-dependent oxidoreductase [Armatimonadetes bacterium]|nr:NAD(P)/FAD-dependent oxidoreductase [Armatimonadota bacterium]
MGNPITQNRIPHTVNPDIKDITIIGAGPVGLFGAFYAGLRGMSIRVIDSLPEPGGQLAALYPDKPIYDMPGFPEVLAGELAEQMYIQASRFNPEYTLGEQCRALECRDGVWALGTSNSEYLTRTAVICGGVGSFTATKIGVEREEFFEGRGLSYGVQNREALRNKRVVVVGGGDSALDWTLSLRGIASEITLVHRHDKFRGHEDSARELLESDVNIRLWEVVTELLGEDQLTGVKTLNRKSEETVTIPCDWLTVNIGYKSRLGPIKKWGLELEKNQILVNSRMQTNLPGIYAAGDLCTYDGKLELIATGVGEVSIAVNNAKHYIDPEARVFPGHSTDMELPELPK